MYTVNKNPSAADVRTFGLVMLGGFGVIGTIFWYRALLTEGSWLPDSGWGWNGSAWHVVAIVLWVLGALSAVICHLSHALGRILYIAWMTAAMYIGIGMTTLMLSLLFIILLPVFSLIRFKDPLRLKMKSAGSYWEDPTPHEATLDRTRRQF